MRSFIFKSSDLCFKNVLFSFHCDVDGDGTEDKKDNCPNLANPGQQDADTDGFGDACDACPSAAGAAGGCPLTPRKIDELWTLGDDVDAKIENVCVATSAPVVESM